MKTLNTLQKLSKVGKIICKIIYICCLIGGIGCIVGIICLACIPDSFKLFGVTVHNIIEKSAETSMGTAYTAMAVGAIFCAGEAILCKIAGRYFKNELAAGTPFTFDGAKEMIRLGIYTICVPIASMTAAGIVYQIMKHCMDGVKELHAENTVSIGLGIGFIVVGLICRYGAEIIESNAKKSEPEAEEKNV